MTAATVWFILGAVASVVLPYLREWLSAKQPFDWRKVVGQLLAAIGVIAGQIVGLADMLIGATAAEAFFIGWGISGGARFIQKSVDMIRR